MFRWLRILHHIGPSGKIHSLAVERVDSPRSPSGDPHARLQRLYFRPRRTVGKHVRNGGQGQIYLRKMSASFVSPSLALPQPKQRPRSRARHISCSRRTARRKEIFHRVGCEIRPVHASIGRQKDRCRQPPLQRRTDTRPCERSPEGCARTHFGQYPHGDA